MPEIPTTTAVADLTSAEVATLCGQSRDQLLTQIHQAVANLTSWGFTPADQERLLERQFGAGVMAWVRAGHSEASE